MTETPAIYRTGPYTCADCGSTARPHYAHGLCHPCYLRQYRARRFVSRVPNWTVCGTPEPLYVTRSRQRVLARRAVAAAHGWRCALALGEEGRP